MHLQQTPSQTIGPFFHRALLREKTDDLSAGQALAERIEIDGRVLDGNGEPVGDALVEIWQANAAGRYDHPVDWQRTPCDANFHGFGRAGTDGQGWFRFRTIKPGPVREAGDLVQAPHINVTVFARGLLRHLYTRIYFQDEALNAADGVLQQVPAERRATLLARRVNSSAERYRIDIVLQGENETVFFDI